MDAQVVPKIKNKVRTIRHSDQLIGDKNKYFIVWTFSYKEVKQNSRVAALE